MRSNGRVTVLPRLVALIAASVVILGLGSTVAASLQRPPAVMASSAQDYRVDVRGLPTLSPDTTSMPEQLATLAGPALLDAIAVSDEVTLRSFASEHADSVDAFLAAAPPAEAVANWWAGTAPQERRVLVRAIPQLVGGLEGVPFATRDAANRAHLANLIAKAEAAEEGSVGRTAQAAASSQLSMLREIERALGRASDAPPRMLVEIDDTWPGRAVVALGNLDTADHVTYLVPGMFFTVQGQIVDWTEIALDLHLDSQSLVRGGALVDESTSVATVAWMGYETPNLFTVGLLDQAREGADALDSSVAGLRSVRGTEPPHVSIVAHSYGSTAASIAMARGTLEVDAVAIVGSPGVAVATAEELGMPQGAVFVCEASWDPVVDTAFHGVDPGGDDFGAIMLGVAGGVDAVAGDTLEAVNGHLGYFTAGSQSMRNFALIGLGRGDLVAVSAEQSVIVAGR